VDPVTHGLVGIAAGLTILAIAEPAAGEKTRRVAALVGLITGELPDADRLIDTVARPYGAEGQGLAYMLYHRGPVHTVLFCLLAALLIAWLTQRFARTWSPALPLLFGIATAGSLAHLAMDAMNDYGVHPLWPYKRWFYGDFLFLAEPTIGAALLPYIVVMFRSKEESPLARRLAWTAALGVLVFIGLVLGNQWLTPFGAVLSAVWLALQAYLQRRGPRPRIAWASMALVLLFFLATSQIARGRATAWAQQTAGEPPTDVVTTPAPANPFCWRVITVSGRGDTFAVHLGVTSLLPFLVDASNCFAPPKGATPHAACGIAQTKLSDDEKVGTLTIVQLAAYERHFSDFDQMARENPRVSATRHFLRVPFWGPDARGGARDCPIGCAPGRMVIGDLRVDYDPDDLTSFSKYSFLPKACEPGNLFLPVGDPPFFKPATIGTCPAPQPDSAAKRPTNSKLGLN